MKSAFSKLRVLMLRTAAIVSAISVDDKIVFAPSFRQASVMKGLAVMPLIIGMALFGGCSGGNKSAGSSGGPPSATGAVPSRATSAPAATYPTLPTKAQPKLQTIKLWLGPEELNTELALTGIQQETGMMFRTNMAENEAMLFVFPFPHQASFWMMNTVLPLSAAYINPDGVILEIHKLEPHNTNSVVAASDQIQYVLETRQGWFDRHNVRTGMVVRSEYGPLKSTFTQRRQ